uniref:Uncharacterized protein n=1 Tax=viral metagenome TaxID=1070528 RepID=A0A6C0KWG8_9ZZZZ
MSFAVSSLQNAHARVLEPLFDQLSVIETLPLSKKVKPNMIDKCRTMIWNVIKKVESMIVCGETYIAASQFHFIPPLIDDLNILAQKYTENLDHFKNIHTITIDDLIIAIILYSCI